MTMTFARAAGDNKFGMKQCPFCGDGPPSFHFRDPLSAREYGISGLCQPCQDDVFKEPADGE